MLFLKDMNLEKKKNLETLEEKVAFLEQFITEERKEKINVVLSRRLTRFSIMLENIYDPHNISAVMRTADGLGFHKIFIIEKEKITKFSRTITTGAERWLDINIFGSTEEGISNVKKLGYKVAAGVLSDRAKNFFEIEWLSDRWAILLGNEHSGLTEQAIEMADLHFIIPMYGFIQSFNISVTAAMIMSYLRHLAEVNGLMGDLKQKEILKYKYEWLKRDLGIEI